MTTMKKLCRRAATAAVCIFTASVALAQAIEFQNTITGEDLHVMEKSNPKGRDTPGVKKFLATGVNPYIEKTECLPKGEEIYLESCSGCHGHIGEGKVGPGLNDSYWTYPKNKTDKGLFETIFGGANGMMGPHNDLEIDEILHLMAWIRHIYKDDVNDADWLSKDQKKVFKPYVPPEHHAEASHKPEACKISAE